MIFKTIEDDATLSGQRITSIFGGIFSTIKSNATIDLSGVFSQSLEQDINALNSYANAIANGVPETQAFQQTMLNASASAREFAASMKNTGMTIDEFAIKQRQAEIQTIASDKSFGSCSSIINTYNNSLESTGLTHSQYISAVAQGNPIMARYLSGLNGANATMGGYVKTLIASKVATIGLRIATTALNAVIGMGIGLIISLISSGIQKFIEWLKDAFKSTEEKLSDLNEEFDELSSKIKTTVSDFRNLRNSIEDLIPRYTKLAQGVNKYGENISLTNEEYEEYIKLNNEIADLFPQINTGMDANGNAMLALSGDVDTLTESLRQLIEIERQQANAELAKNLPNLVDNVNEQIKIYNKDKRKQTNIQSYADAGEYEDFIKRFEEARQVIIDAYGSYEEFLKLDENDQWNLSDLVEEFTFHSQITDQDQSWNQILKDLYNLAPGGDEAWAALLEESEREYGDYNWFAMFFDKRTDAMIDALRNRSEYAEVELQKIEKETKQKYNSLLSSFLAWAETDSDYKLIDEDLQNVASKLISNLNIEKLADDEGIVDTDYVKDYIRESVLYPLQNATPEVKEAVSNLFNVSDFFDGNIISYDSYKNFVNDTIEALKEEGLDEGFLNLLLSSFDFDEFDKQIEYAKSLVSSEYKDLVGTLSASELSLAYKIVAEEGSLTFDELKERIKELGYIGADMVDSIDLDAFTDKLDDVTNGLDKIVSSMNKLKEGTALSTNEIVNLISKYPELLKQANLFTDNSVEGQQRMLQNLLNVYEAEYDATIDTKIAELKATNECLQAQMEIEKKKLEIVEEIRRTDFQSQAEGQQWLTKKIAEFNQLEAQSYVTMESGKLMVNEAALTEQLSKQAKAQGETADIWYQTEQAITGYNIDAANGAVSATEQAKSKITTKLSALAQKFKRFAQAFKNMLAGKGWTYDDSSGIQDDHSTTIDSSGIKINGTDYQKWLDNQLDIYNGRMADLQSAIDSNNTIIENLENLKGLDLSTILDSGTSSLSSDKENTTETIDYIAIALDRAKESLDKFKSAASSAYSTLSARSTAVKGAINAVTKEINTQYSAAQAYLNAANSVGLSNTLVAKIQNGSMNIAEYDNDTADKIKAYQDYYEKYLACIKSAEDLKEELASLYKENFDNIQKDYSNRLTFLEHSAKTLNNQIDLIEAQGHTVTASYYNKLIDVEKGKIDILYAEKSALEKALNEAVASGKIAKYSEAWYEMMNQIYAVDEAIQEGNIQIAEFNKEIRNIEWDAFDAGIDKFDKLLDETDFLIKLLKQNDLVDENGKFTKSGKATIGLHSYNYKVYLAEAEKFADEIERLNAEIAKDPSNKELIERRDELLEKQRDSILAAQDEKDAIKDLVEDAIDAELDALEDLIDKYKDALDSAKD